MYLDLHHRPTLLKSWLATLHGEGLTVRANLTSPLPRWGPLLRTAVAWHVAYALAALAGALAVARGQSTSSLALAVQSGGTSAVIAVTLVLWWGGVAIGSALWWASVKRARQLSNQANS